MTKWIRPGGVALYMITTPDKLLIIQIYCKLSFTCKDRDILLTRDIQLRPVLRASCAFFSSCTIRPFRENHIGGVMISVLASSAVDRGFEPRSGKTRLSNWCLLLLRKGGNIKEKEQRLVGSQSGYCVRVGQHVNLRTIVSVSQHYKNPAKCVDLVQSGPHHHIIED